MAATCFVLLEELFSWKSFQDLIIDTISVEKAIYHRLFLGGKPTSLCHLFRPSVLPSVMHQMSGTLYHLNHNFWYTHVK